VAARRRWALRRRRRTWEPVGNEFAYEGEAAAPVVHGTQHLWEFARVRHAE
jgi:hypothetical protein